MIVKTLVENRTISEEFKPKHGLSIYIETSKHKVLFDLGSTDLFLINAKKLDVDISSVDTLIISHGHLDHAGGLKYFLENNSKALIYVQKHAFDKHYIKDKEGNYLDVSIPYFESMKDRLVYVDDYLQIDSELTLFSSVNGHKYEVENNKNLFIDNYLLDDFKHEQYLLVNESKLVLFGGCGHKGLINVLDRLNEFSKEPDYIISGLHLLDPITKKNEDIELINDLGSELNKYRFILYTCHCTGIDNYNSLKEIMKDKIKYLSTGEVLQLW